MNRVKQITQSDGTLIDFNYDDYGNRKTKTVNVSESFIITATYEGQGTISPSGEVHVTTGQDQTFTLIPDTGYLIADLNVDGMTLSDQDSYTFTNVSAAHTLHAVFTEDASYNDEPESPGLVSPEYGVTTNTLSPVLSVGAFSDPDAASTHAKTQWQIALSQDFDPIILDITTMDHLTSLTVPVHVLEPGAEYFWRVRFTDDTDRVSEWSDTGRFTTPEDDADVDDNGLPDDFELNDTDDSQTPDLDADGTPDDDQDDLIRIKTFDGLGIIGIKCLTEGADVVSLSSIDPMDIDDEVKRPEVLPYGLIGFKLAVDNPGDDVSLAVYFSDPMTADLTWYKYDTVGGWYDYSQDAVFGNNNSSVTLHLKDGGVGDSDGVVNGFIIDPSGPVLVSSETPQPPSSTGGGDDGVCFISTIGWLTSPWGWLVGLMFILFGGTMVGMNIQKQKH